MFIGKTKNSKRMVNDETANTFYNRHVHFEVIYPISNFGVVKTIP